MKIPAQQNSAISNSDYTPSISKKSFLCPKCGYVTMQTWYNAAAVEILSGLPTVLYPDDVKELTGMVVGVRADALIKRYSKKAYLEHETERKATYVYNINYSVCHGCENVSIWVHDTLVFPRRKSYPPPNEDLPEDIKSDYHEAGVIFQDSPRGAAALLRLCLQKLCEHLGQKGKTIDKAIAEFVKKGLDEVVQQSLDIVRIVGNESVHPGVMDIKDNHEIVLHLFKLINVITTHMISSKKEAQELYTLMPKEKRDAIKKRDGS